jgi:uncharacterized DUF497 family protein
MDFKITDRVLRKLRERHGVEREEVGECFLNRTGKFYGDSREDNKTDPPTYWFVAETDKGRLLKVVFVRYPDRYQIKSAYPPDDGSDRLYEKLEEGRKESI